MAKQQVTVPDIGGAEAAEVIEVLVAVGDEVAVDQGLIVLESDKASMEIPTTVAGTVVELLVAEGQQLAEGAPVVVIEVAGEPGNPQRLKKRRQRPIPASLKPAPRNQCPRLPPSPPPESGPAVETPAAATPQAAPRRHRVGAAAGYMPPRGAQARRGVQGGTAAGVGSGPAAGC